MKPATKLGLWVAVDELLTLLVWAALAGLLWKFGEGVIAERIGAVIAEPGERSAWIALLLVAGTALLLMMGLRWIARTVVGIVTLPFIRRASNVRAAPGSRTDSHREK